MLLEQETRPVETRGLSAVATATIKATPKIFSFFEDNTYSNKPLAICRELVSNAIDAHTAAGVPDAAVEVWLPTDLDPMFRVRDQGIGMSHEFMMTSFLAYTDGSTKDDSNDQIGGFGIGSKSPFAYTDQFTIRSVHQGILSIYTMFKNEDGIPSLGLLSQSPTSEVNGVEVNFPVEADDFRKFHKAAQKGLQHFNPLPVVYGGELLAPVYMNSGDGWAMRPEYGELNIIMGGVCYPVQTHNLDYRLQSHNDLSALLNFGLDVTMPIGSCGVALSRENLSYDSKTSDVIEAKLTSLIEEITASFATMFDRCETLWEAKLALYEEIKDTYSGRGKFLSDKAFYKGMPFTDKFEVQCSYWNIECPTKRRGKTNSKLVASWTNRMDYSFSPGRFEQIIIDDLPQLPKSRTSARIKEYVSTVLVRDIQSIVLRPIGGDTVEDLLAQLGGIPPEAYVRTSTMDLPFTAKNVYVKTDRPRVRMFTYDGREELGKDYTQINPGHFGKRGVEEIFYDYQPDEGVLVVMENFNLPAGLRRKVNTGLLNWRDLRFVNTGDAPKLKGQWWLPYDQVFQDQIIEILTDQPLLPEMLALAYDSELQDVFRIARSLGTGITLTPAQRSRPFGKIFSLYQSHIAPLTDRQHSVRAYIDHAWPKRLDAKALVASFHEKQPRASRLADLNRNDLEHDTQFFLELI